VVSKNEPPDVEESSLWIGVRSRAGSCRSAVGRLPLTGSEPGGAEDQWKWRRRMTIVVKHGKEQVARCQSKRIRNPEGLTLKDKGLVHQLIGCDARAGR
jgi:hypothetical protein